MDNQRLILFLVFSFSLIMLWEAWQKQGQPQPVAQSAAPASQTTAAGGPAVPAPSAATGGPAVPTAAAGTAGGATVAVKTDLMVVEIAAQGGDLTHLEFTQHKATEDRSRNFVLLDRKHAYAAQSGLIGEGLPNHKSVWRLPGGVQELKEGESELRVRLEAETAGGQKVAKTYVFHRGDYRIEVEHEIEGAAISGAHGYFQLIRDGKAPEGANAMMATFTGPAFYTEAEKFRKVDFEDIAKKKAKHPGKTNDGWVAMVQHYFVTAWLPAGTGEREFYLNEVGKDLYSAGVIVPMNGSKLSVPFYAGPQEQEKLAKIAPGLDLVVDYGWLTVIAAPIFWVLEWLYAFTGNWGWAIILMTVALKAAFFPLSAASYKSMAKMRVLTPKLTKLKETYGDDRQRMNQEMMDLYKKEKVNPLGGCLPILVQIPVFIALYWVLLGSVEMRQAPWLGWINDLSAKDPYFILPLIMGVTMFIQTKLNPTPPDPIQAKVMLFMPIMFTGMFLFFPAGLVLYWTVNNILSIAQQWQITRLVEAGEKK